MSTLGTQLDASEVLAAALEQMDGIIAGTKLDFHDGVNDNHSCTFRTKLHENHSRTVNNLLKELRNAVEIYMNTDANDNRAIKEEIDSDTRFFLLHWLQHSLSPECVRKVGGFGQDFEDTQEKLHHLEAEKENLHLQVNILSEQIDAQNDKIQDLEKIVEEKKEHVDSMEEMLRQELMSRSYIENSKLDLMSEVSTFRLRLATAEQERRDIEEKYKKLESELVIVQARLAEKEAELATLKSRAVRNGTVTPITEYGSEIDKLKRALESVMAANDEKEKKIEELRSTLNMYKRMQDLAFPGQGKKEFSSCRIGQLRERIPSEDSLISNPNNESNKKNQSEQRLIEKPPPVPRLLPPPISSSSPNNTDVTSPNSWKEGNLSQYTPSSSPVYNVSNFSPSSFNSSPIQRASSAENVSPPQQKTPPAKRNYVTMPRQHGTQLMQQIQNQLENTTCNNGTSLLEHQILQAQPEASLSPQETLRSMSFLQGSPVFTSKQDKEKNKGIKKILGKLKRTGSQSLDVQEGELKRGGIRATAGPRLGWSADTRTSGNIITDIPFSQWDAQMLANWLQRIGLSMYVTECKRWIKSGDQLLKATSHELEKELGIKNVLHRKKLQLAIQSMHVEKNTLIEAAGKLDNSWVVRWLDDIGLPQYKESFCESRIDGCMLHFLTVEDLFNLKVTNQLHHISIRRSIQVLRANNFDPYALKRRSLPEETKHHSPEEVALWTNHRVMEWLRTVDLSEYAPNLRGSGVHGALLIYELRFTDDLLATLLNIPTSKTLLRRHLSTQFKQLIGLELMHQKRDYETNPAYIPLVPSTKVKAVRRGQFSLMRKRGKNEAAFEDYVCPLDASAQISHNSEGEYEKHATQQLQTSEFSQENKQNKEDNIINDNSFTTLLNNEKLFETMETTNV